MEKTFALEGPNGAIAGKITFSGSARAKERLLVIAHGFRGSMDGGGRASALAEQAAAGAQVIRFNFTESQILSKQVEELALVVDYGVKLLQPKSLYLLGRSLGGATAIVYLAQTAARLKLKPPSEVKLGGLILWSTPNNLKKTFQAVLGVSNFEKLYQGQPVTLQDYKGKFTLQPETVRDMLQYDLSDCLGRIGTMPSLILHGTADAIVSLEQPQANYDALREPKELVLLPGGDHSFVSDSTSASRVVLDWLQKH